MNMRELELFLRDRLTAPLPGADAQWRFAPRPSRKGWSPDQRPAEARRASSLMLLYPGSDGPAMALTLRRDDLPQHPGQVSLPGGAIDAGEDVETAALRETHEEIGVPAESIRVIGPLSSLWVIVSNFLVQPFVGIVDERPDFALAEHEVAALVEAPVPDIYDAQRVEWHQIVVDGIVIRYPALVLDGHAVWGATAMMLAEFACLFDPDFGRAHDPPNRT